jgi:hypothetical protein
MPVAPEHELDLADEGGSSGLLARARRLRPAARGFAAFLIFVAASLAVWAAPIITQLSTRWIGRGATDSKLYQWSLAWVDWSIWHMANPLYTDKVWAPHGTSLAWVTFMPAAGVLLTPVVWLVGRVAALNVLMVLAVALACWGGYLVCNRLTGAFWPSVAGGYLFGFSQYMAGQMHGHVNLVLLFPVPLAVYLAIRSVERSIGWIAFVALMSLLLVTQFLFTTELFATMAVFGVIAFVIALVAGGPQRDRVLVTGLLTAGSYAIAGVLLIPYIVAALRYAPDAGVRDTTHASVDLFSFVVPRDITLVSPGFADAWAKHFRPSSIEDGAYLSVALVAMLVLFAVTERRRRGTWPLLAFVLVVSIAALGPVLHVNGRSSIGLPWGVVSDVPLIQSATPDRFPAYSALAIGVIAAIWLARSAGRTAALRWALVLAAPVLLLPNVSTILRLPQTVPPFFTTGEYRGVLSPDEIVFAIPTVNGDEMAWQAESDFWFRLAQGYVGPIPPEFAGVQLSRGLSLTHKAPFVPDPAVFAAWLRSHEVSSIVISDPARVLFEPLLRSVDAGLIDEGGGVSVWRPSGLAWRSIDTARVDYRGEGLGKPGAVLRSVSAPLAEGSGRMTMSNVGFEGPALLLIFKPDCGCAADLEVLERVHQALRDVRIFALASFATQDQTLPLLEGAGPTYQVGFDPIGRVAVALAIDAHRALVVMDAHGRIAGQTHSPLTFEGVIDLVSNTR